MKVDGNGDWGMGSWEGEMGFIFLWSRAHFFEEGTYFLVPDNFSNRIWKRGYIFYLILNNFSTYITLACGTRDFSGTDLVYGFQKTQYFQGSYENI